MTDIELTRLAALAIGGAPDGFSPLTDDWDAIRLAVKLGLDVCLIHKQLVSSAMAVELHNSDPYADTRRAITRAAAEIGKAAP